jgi:small subunit ribosomal protein S17
MPEGTERNERKTREGIVVSDKMEKTRVIAVERLVQHPLYRRTMRETVRFKAHDESNDTHTGDRVLVMETRPLSKEKRWRIVEVLERAR